MRRSMKRSTWRSTAAVARVRKDGTCTTPTLPQTLRCGIGDGDRAAAALQDRGEHACEPGAEARLDRGRDGGERGGGGGDGRLRRARGRVPGRRGSRVR